MKKLLGLLIFLALNVHAANPAFTDFNTSDFSTTGNKVKFSTGVTNWVIGLSGGSATNVWVRASPSIDVLTNTPGSDYTPSLNSSVSNQWKLDATNAANFASQNATNAAKLSAMGFALLTDATNAATKAAQNATNALASSAFGNAAGLTTGALPDARLSANVPLMTANVLPAVDGHLLTGVVSSSTNAGVVSEGDYSYSVNTNGSTYTFWKPFDPSRMNVIVYGSSLSSGSPGWFDGFGRSLLYYPAWTNVLNRGFPYWQDNAEAGGGLARAMQIMATNALPRLGAGTNGIVFTEIGVWEDLTGTGLTNTMVTYSNWLYQIKTNGYRTAVFTKLLTTGGSPYTTGTTNFAIPFNDWIRRLTNVVDYVIDWARMFPDFNNTNYYSADGLHLNTFGYNQTAEAVDWIVRNGPGRADYVPTEQGFYRYGTNYYVYDVNDGRQLAKLDGSGVLTATVANAATATFVSTSPLTNNISGTSASTTDAGTYWGAQATLGTNTLTLNNKYYYFNAANDTSITNLTTGGGGWAVLVLNNTNASTTIHCRCDVSGIGIIGTVAYTANTNGLVVAAGKTAVYSVMSLSKTNYSNAVQQ